ncbi:MAG TPA: glycine zipper domain-containing protein [Tepidisphaeraceae bacterium]|jgi:uncharacterized protein YcfJ|nr:glycine zipper domain-containing protein [Tepidisphaeraceae bacterium]
MNSKIRFAVVAVLAGAMGLSSVGCESKAQTGALVGAGGGALLGGAIGSMSHSRAGAGAAIGAGVGAIGGYVVGNEMDKKDQKKRDAAAASSARTSNDYRSQPARSTATTDGVTRDDVIRWSKDGVKDEVIIDRIQRSGTTFSMTASDESALRDANVSEDVMRAMKNSAR